MDVNEVFNLVKYRATKSGYDGVISSNDFNLLFPRAEIRYLVSLYAPKSPNKLGYPGTIKTSSSLSPFGSDATPITIDNTGRYTKPGDFFYVDSIRKGLIPIVRVEKQDLSANLNSYYEAPSVDFPIYVEYGAYIQFYPITLGSATLNYIKAPAVTKWAYTLNGSIGLTNNLVGGTGYANGSYPNTPLTGGDGNSALATITVAGGVVTNVQITKAGFMYKVGNTLSASNTNLGGAGAGFSVSVATITNAREVYDKDNSVDPQWGADEIDNIVYVMLSDIAINNRDADLANFANNKTNSGV